MPSLEAFPAVELIEEPVDADVPEAIVFKGVPRSRARRGALPPVDFRPVCLVRAIRRERGTREQKSTEHARDIWIFGYVAPIAPVA